MRNNFDDVFRFDEIGSAIESLVKLFYQTKFTKKPFADLNEEQTKFILDDTVVILLFI